MPRNAAEAKGLLLASIRDPDPVIFFEPKILYRTSVEQVPDGDYEVPLGVADVMREGTDVTLVRAGPGKKNKKNGRKEGEKHPQWKRSGSSSLTVTKKPCALSVRGM